MEAQSAGDSVAAERCRDEKAGLEAKQEKARKALETAQGRDHVKQAKEGAKCSSVRVPVTDPQSHVLPNKEGGYAPNYNPVLAVEPSTGLIVGGLITAENSESDCLVDLVQQAEENCEGKVNRVVADSNFGSGPELAQLKKNGVQTYKPVGPAIVETNPAIRDNHDEAVAADKWDQLPLWGGKLAKSAFIYQGAEDAYYCPMGHRLGVYRQQSRVCRDGHKVMIKEYRGAPCAGCALASRCLSGKASQRTISRDEYECLREEIAARMLTEQGRSVYARRAPVVEGAIGTIKSALGMRRFGRRGLKKVREDWTWTCIAYNLKKMMAWAGQRDFKKHYVATKRRLKSIIRLLLIGYVAPNRKIPNLLPVA